MVVHVGSPSIITQWCRKKTHTFLLTVEMIAVALDLKEVNLINVWPITYLFSTIHIKVHKQGQMYYELA